MAISSSRGDARDLRPASSTSLTTSSSAVPADGCTSPTAETTGSRCSIRTGTSSSSGNNSASRVQSLWARTTRYIGNAIEGSLKGFIPDPADLDKVIAGTSASGIAADSMGSVFAADVGAHNLRKYVKIK